jgi:FAD/FMN-containing dehydrogenase
VRSLARMPRTQPAPLDVDVIGLYWGLPADVNDLLKPVEQVQAAAMRTVEAMPFPAARDFLEDETPTGTYGIKTGFVRGAPSAAAITTMLQAIQQMPGTPSRAQESSIGFYGMGGKVNDLAPDANAFVHRGVDLIFKCEVLWMPQDDPALIAANLEWLEDAQAAMKPYLAGGAYQNFTDRTQIDWQHAYYGDNFPRLVEIKRKWDPDNLFRHPQSIPVTI